MKRIAWLLAAVLGCAATTARAGPIVPRGLQPGDKYYLAFISRDARDATSSAIADYNAFVTLQAGLSPGLTGTSRDGRGVRWFAVGSTQAVTARGNLGLLEAPPIYLLDGTSLVSRTGTGLWSGALAHAIDLDQFANRTTALDVWTGTNPDGSVAANLYLGIGGDNPAQIGRPSETDSTWVDVSRFASSEDLPFYAVSQLLTAPQVPEPATSWPMLVGATAACAAGLRCRGSGKRQDHGRGRSRLRPRPGSQPRGGPWMIFRLVIQCAGSEGDASHSAMYHGTLITTTRRKPLSRR
jgi:hypothetical protein